MKHKLSVKQSIELQERKTTERQQFIRVLVEYLVGNQVEQGIGLQVGKQSAMDWAKLRGATPLFGYPHTRRSILETM
jgi:hypothetical protein